MALSVTVHKLEPVLFPGDTFRCIIEVKNTLAASGDEEYDLQRVEPLAWVSAQIYGQYVADPTFIKLPEETLQRHVAGSTLPKLGTTTMSAFSPFPPFPPSNVLFTLLFAQTRMAASCILAMRRFCCAICVLNHRKVAFVRCSFSSPVFSLQSLPFSELKG